MHTIRSVTTAAVSVVAGGVALGLVPSAAATAGALSERFAGRAGAQVAEVSLFGRSTTFGSAMSDSSLDAVGGQLSATATGVGTGLVPETRSVARFGDAGAVGGTNCATPRLGSVLSRARSGAAGTDAPVPDIEVAPACGSSRVTGTPSAFSAESSGGGTGLTVRVPDVLQSWVRTIGGQLAPGTLAAPVGDLLHIDLPSATARTAGDAKAYLTEAVSQGGVIDVLPGFRGPDLPPLLRITITPSRAAVPVDRASTTAAPTVANPLVRIESDLLGTLPVAGPPVLGGLVHGVPLSAVPGGTLPVVGGLLGGGLPLDRLVPALGLRSGSGYVELGPGQNLSVLCDGPTAALCTEIAVSEAKAPATLPGGATHAEASTVTVHLFKRLDGLVPGTSLGTALARPAAMKALADAPDGVSMGDVTGIPGIRLVAGGVVAEGGGARVLPAEITAAAVPSSPASAPAPAAVAAVSASAPADPTAPAGNLPHTGGEPFNRAAGPALIGSSVALGSLSRRRRRA